MSRRLAMITSLCLGLSGMLAQASTVAYLDVSTSHGYADTIAINGMNAGDNGQFYGHHIAEDGFTLSANMLGDSTMPRLGGSLQISNATNDEVEYVVGFLMPLMDVVPGDYEWDASLTLSITGIDGSVRSLAEEPIWASSVGGNFLGSMFTNPFELAFEGPGTAAIQDAISGGISYLDADMLSVRYAFALSPGDTVVFGGSLGFIPSPGALCLLGLAALSARRRRRTASPA
ncbi:MAG: hypothetical protein VX527_09145 [Planctomycetota bacterium]|nr:hypothetical protein [Planctomycetota bacterium]